MEQAGIGDIRLIILGVARRPTAYAGGTLTGAAACFVLFGLHTASTCQYKGFTIVGTRHQCAACVKRGIVTVGTDKGNTGAIFNTKHLIFGIPQIGVLCDFCFILISYIFDISCKC